MDNDCIKISSTKLQTSTYDDVQAICEAEKDKIEAKCRGVAASGCNVFINRQLIYDGPREILTSLGVNAIEHADFDGISRLSKVLGGSIVSKFDTVDLSNSLGSCECIEEVSIGDESCIHFK